MTIARTGADRCPGIRRPFVADDGTLVRLRVPGGVLSTTVLSAMVTLARRWGAPYLQVTSRGNIQVRALPNPLPAEFVSAVEATGLLPSVTHELARNVLADPLAPDLQPLVAAFDEGLCADPALADLPGRFLVAFSGEGGLVLGERWDLAYQRRSPTSGLLLAAGRGREVAPTDAAQALLAAARVFVHTRAGEQVWHTQDLPPNSPVFAGMSAVTLQAGAPLRPGPAGSDLVCGVPLGMLDAAMVQALAQVSDEVVLTPWRSLVLPGLLAQASNLSTIEALSSAGLVVAAGSGWDSVSACVGAPSCARTDVPTMEFAREAVRRLSGTPDLERVHVSGCERRCGAPTQRHIDVLSPASADCIVAATAGDLATGGGVTTGGSASPEVDPAGLGLPTPRYDYVRDGLEIYRRSFAMIRGEARLAGLEGDLATVATRIVHASGDTDVVRYIAAHCEVIPAARAALRAGAPILTDSMMLAAGITWRRLPAGNEVICTLRHRGVPALAASWGTTRAAAAVSLWQPYLAGAVVAVGNAPTALFHLLEVLHDGGPRPAAIIGMPVGFIGSAESKVALAEHALVGPRGSEQVPWMVLHGRRGGSAMAASAVNAIATPDELA